MPCTTSSLTDMQVTAGKGHLAGHALEQRDRACSLRRTRSTAASISPVVTPGRTISAAIWCASQTSSPALRIWPISRGERKSVHARNDSGGIARGGRGWHASRVTGSPATAAHTRTPPAAIVRHRSIRTIRSKTSSGVPQPSTVCNSPSAAVVVRQRVPSAGRIAPARRRESPSGWSSSRPRAGRAAQQLLRRHVSSSTTVQRRAPLGRASRRAPRPGRWSAGSRRAGSRAGSRARRAARATRSSIDVVGHELAGRHDTASACGRPRSWRRAPARSMSPVERWAMPSCCDQPLGLGAFSGARRADERRFAWYVSRAGCGRLMSVPAGSKLRVSLLQQALDSSASPGGCRSSAPGRTPR